MRQTIADAPSGSTIDFVTRQNNVAFILIELGSIFLGSYLTAALDIIQYFLNGIAHIAGISLRGLWRLFQIFD